MYFIILFILLTHVYLGHFMGEFQMMFFTFGPPAPGAARGPECTCNHLTMRFCGVVILLSRSEFGQ